MTGGSEGQTTCLQGSGQGPEKSCGTFFETDFPHAAHNAILARSLAPEARPFDPYRYRALFPDLWAAFLRLHYRSAIEVAVTFDVTERMARNWLDGVNRPSGHTVALAALRHPESFAQHFRKAA